jgi:plastocyanin
MLRRSIAAALLAPFLLLIAALAAPVTQAGGGCHGGSDTPPGDDAASVVKIDGCMFYPTIARVPVGTTVTFINSGAAPHNVTGVGGEWGSGDLPNGARYAHGFAQPGVYPFACTLHPGMNGAIVVGDGAADAPASAQLTTSAPPTDARPAAPDPIGLGVAGLAGFVIGALLVALGSRVASRRRTTA